MEDIQAKPTEYSDHKAFIINVKIDMEIIPIPGNNRLIVDKEDRQEKNLWLQDQLINKKYD